MTARGRMSLEERAKLGLRGRRVMHKDRIIKARKEAPTGAELEGLALIYQALSDPTRLRLMQTLWDGEMCVCDLAAFLEISESAMSHRLRKLRTRGLVRKRREGRIIYYALDDRHVELLLAAGLEHAREKGKGRDSRGSRKMK